MKLIKFLCCIVLIFLLPSCTTTKKKADTNLSNYQNLTEGFPIGSTFFIEPVHAQGSLLAKAIEDKLATKLRNLGFTAVQADQSDTANYSIACTINTQALEPQTPSQPKTFNHYLQLKVNAKNNTKPDQKELLWQGSAYIKNLDKNPRNSIDYLLTSALNHFGKNIQKSQTT